MKKIIASIIIALTTQTAFATGFISGDDEDVGVCAVLLISKKREDDAVRVMARASDRAKAVRAGQDFFRYLSEYRNDGNKVMFKKMIDNGVMSCVRHGISLK